MQLQINGATVEVPDFRTVADLAAWLELPAFGSAVELDGHVVRKADHATTPLREGARLEVVRLVGGG